MPWTAPVTEPRADPALTRAFEPCLPGRRLSGPLLAFCSVTSTQVVARGLAAGGAPEGTVVVADHQTAGRGRRGRSWTAPRGTALLFSCVLRPPLEPERWPELGLAAACGVAEALEEVAGVATRLKWPNDVLVDRRKVAGILAEGVLGANPFAVLGIGVNVLQRPGDWPTALAARAVSLAGLGADTPREILLARILARLAARYDELLSQGFEPVREAWRGRALLGERVRGLQGEGVSMDLDPHGGLIVRHDDGVTTTIVGGDAVPVGSGC